MKYVYALATIAAFATPAFAAQTMSSLPSDSFTVTDYYKQDVYDQSKNTVGKIDDVLIDKSGKITALIVGVGGFLGMGAHLVAVPYDKIKFVNEPVAYTGASNVPNAPAGTRPPSTSTTTTGSAANPPAMATASSTAFFALSRSSVLPPRPAACHSYWFFPARVTLPSFSLPSQ